MRCIRKLNKRDRNDGLRGPETGAGLIKSPLTPRMSYVALMRRKSDNFLDNHRLEWELTSQKEDNAGLKRELTSQKEDNAGLKRELRNLGKELQKITQSRSWRYTALLRKVLKLLRAK